MDGVLSGKTGFTNKAGYCYVGAVKQEGKYLIAAVLASGWPPHKTYKWADVKALIQYGMTNYQYQKLSVQVPKEWMLSVRKGEADRVKAYAQVEDIQMLAKAGEKITTTYYLEGKLEAPLQKEQKVGEVQCYLGGILLQSWPIVLMDSVSRKQTLLEKIGIR